MVAKRKIKSSRKAKNPKIAKKVPNESAFYFNTWDGPTGIKAQSVSEFKSALKKVPVEALYFHMRDDKNDFEEWMRNALNEPVLADRLREVKGEMLEGEHLRRALYFHI